MLAAIGQWALGLGATGLFVIAVLDSSFLSFPNVVDALLVVLSIRHPHLLPLYAGASTLGSVGGCLVLFSVGRKGGEAFLRRRFAGKTVDRALRFYRSWGFAAIAGPAILPPPTPFKLLTLLAGAFGMTPATFAAAVTVGRIVRYLAEGLLAIRYGPQAAEFLGHHGWGLLLAAVVLVIVVMLAWQVGGRTRNEK